VEKFSNHPGNFALIVRYNVSVMKFANVTITKRTAFIAFLFIIITTLHYFGGDHRSPIHNFYKQLYLIPIVISGFYFGFKGGITASIVSSLFHSPFVLLSLSAIRADYYYDLLDIVIFLAVGMITGIFTQKRDFHVSQLGLELKRQKLLETYSNSVIESIKCGVVAINKDSLITMINKSAAKTLNCAVKQSIGQAISEILPQSKSYIDSSLAENKVQENIELNLNQAGKNKMIRLRIFPLNFENEIKGLVTIIEDITELRTLQSQIIRNEKFNALGELSSGIAHEIRNPLAIIKAIGQTMQKECINNPEVVKELAIIDEEIERANKVVKELLEFGKPPKKEFMICSVNEILEDVLTISKKYLILHSVEVKHIKNETPLIWADKAQLKQAFINVIFNGTQAMSQGGTLTITTSDQNGQYCKIEISDTGEGIDEENLERVFNPFFTTKEHGTGLGLSIVQRIIEEHSGIITITSKKGTGTQIQILLPYVEKVQGK
jgi:PAS domain S-box-containing protein